MSQTAVYQYQKGIQQFLAKPGFSINQNLTCKTNCFDYYQKTNLFNMIKIVKIIYISLPKILTKIKFMKKLMSIAALLAVFFITGVRANNASVIGKSLVVSGDTTVTFAVNGNAACKSSIESALTSNSGVVSATWDSGSQTITVTFHMSSLQITDLYPLLANAGYDNAELRAKDAIYAALPTACQYTRTAPTE